MKLEKIYQKKNAKQVENIFQFSGGLKIIKRSDAIVEKLNIEKWEVINFIPENFREVQRSITLQEEKKVKKICAKYCNRNCNKKNNTIWKKIKNFWKGFK